MRRPRLTALGALAAVSLLVPASAAAQGDRSVQPRIVGGHAVSISRYPWQAALFVDGEQTCGGSLLTSRIVITAAHCVADTDPNCLISCSISDPGGDGTTRLDPNDGAVMLGSSRLNGPQSPFIGVAVRSSYEPTFRPLVPRNDVGFLVLAGPSGQTPIKIAGSDEGALWDPGSPVDISGWGDTEAGPPPDTLQAATVQVIDDGTCSADYGANFDRNAMLCAGFQSGGVDACAGDSGGPLQAPLPTGGYRLVGITSWGEGCADPGRPGVYARIAQSTVLGPQIAADVASLETAFGLPHEPVFGSAVPLGARAKAKKPFAKCKRIRSKKKRKRCIKKVKRKQKRA
jgi:secreted trypsin-like serine protease